MKKEDIEGEIIEACSVAMYLPKDTDRNMLIGPISAQVDKVLGRMSTEEGQYVFYILVSEIK